MIPRPVSRNIFQPVKKFSSLLIYCAGDRSSSILRRKISRRSHKPCSNEILIVCSSYKPCQSEICYLHHLMDDCIGKMWAECNGFTTPCGSCQEIYILLNKCSFLRLFFGYVTLALTISSSRMLLVSMLQCT